MAAIHVSTSVASAGCFTAKYPSTIWVSTQCKPAPPHPLQVGSGNDPIAITNSPIIVSAAGSFQNVTVTDEHDNQAPNGGANDFSLQLNTNVFPTSTSNGAYNHEGTSNNPCMNSGCYGWQQFVLANDPTDNSGQTGVWLYIQYWLTMAPNGIGYYQANGICPSSQIQGGLWGSSWMQGGTNNTGCYINSPAVSLSAPSPPTLTISDLSQLTLEGVVDLNGLDVTFLYIQLQPNEVQVFSTGWATNFLGLNKSWSQAEFNVFGLWGGSQAVFNPGTTITTVLTLNPFIGGAPISPSCATPGGTSGETNSLNLSPCACFPNGGQYGGQIVFTESNATSRVCACPANQTWNPKTSSCGCSDPTRSLTA